ncbi:hypothetical protein [Bifidobacterium vansinderenii]|uniref:Uncharacterized protein n=1 Tax=Bifidobacterium vansinderenii TaxID=1984871 RepID=A0A229VXT5_9BIFI|nr:hypothetical protein [Bifidobacterium vansinderenii]OXN00425.1 hypothetical protein Tam10B_1295 [Bifidobacterium vansinderenii]
MAQMAAYVPTLNARRSSRRSFADWFRVRRAARMEEGMLDFGSLIVPRVRTSAELLPDAASVMDASEVLPGVGDSFLDL